MTTNEALLKKLALADAVLGAVAESGLLRKRRRVVRSARKSTRKAKANGANRTAAAKPKKATKHEPTMPSGF